MAECENCGNHVSDRFARVMGDNQNNVHSCMECGVQAIGREVAGVQK